MSDRTQGAQPATTAPAGTPDEQPTDEPKFTQAQIDKLIQDRLERQRRALETKRIEEQQQAETQQLEDKREFEKLAQQRAKEIDQLKPRAGLAESYEKGVSRLMAKATESLPSNIQTLLNKLSLPDQLDWLSENLDSVKAPPITTAQTNINAWARGNGNQPQALTDEEYRAKKRREMGY